VSETPLRTSCRPNDLWTSVASRTTSESFAAGPPMTLRRS
jgi:hypothetical protein